MHIICIVSSCPALALTCARLFLEEKASGHFNSTLRRHVHRMSLHQIFVSSRDEVAAKSTGHLGRQ